ncbi:hypothetical protein WMF31_00475 [Sorangium sp. So ce1036]|uniref:hypothetical protein n=1 Tax=Sorangium sp. So ce1036 TaxID=3133328 RepID=UPI003F074E43
MPDRHVGRFDSSTIQDNNKGKMTAMKLAHIFACMSSLVLVACVSGEPQESPGEAEDPGHAAARDPLGIDLEAVGLSAGDAPCGEDAHVASIVDEAGRYLAFCASDSGGTSVLQITPGGVAPVGAPSACALDTFLAASPEGTPVPRALVAACKDAPRLTRALSDAPVVVNTPPAALDGIAALGPCQSAAVFTSVHCGAIDDYASHPQVADSVSWCRVGPFSGGAQRTASQQGLPYAFEGRMTVAACGAARTNFKGYVKKGISGAWAVVPGVNVTLSPNRVATRDIHHYDVPEYDNFNTPHYGLDLRFTVTPSDGAWYRYTGAFIEYPPVP